MHWDICHCCFKCSRQSWNNVSNDYHSEGRMGYGCSNSGLMLVQQCWRRLAAVTSVNFCLQLTNWCALFHCCLARGQFSPGLQITLGLECVLWTAGDSSAFSYLPCILHWRSSSIYARDGYIAPVAFQGLFSSSEVFFFFCPLPNSYSVLFHHLEGQKLWE